MVAMLTAVAANYRYGEAVQHPLAFYPLLPKRKRREKEEEKISCPSSRETLQRNQGKIPVTTAISSSGREELHNTEKT